MGSKRCAPASANTFGGTGLFNARHVFPGASIDLDDLVLIDEQGHANHRSGRQFCRLDAAARRVALDAGVGFDDFEPTPLNSFTFVNPTGESLVYLMTFSGATDAGTYSGSTIGSSHPASCLFQK